MATQTTTMPRPSVYFSFVAYVKNVIDHLKSCKIPVLEGLTDNEFSSIEASFNFVFPPDLRSILCEGLPVGPGFPNWRSSSLQQLQILIKLPVLGIFKEISKGAFWCQSWGDEPDDHDEALALAKQLLNKAPILVPIYKHCYIPSKPNLAGNPVFLVEGGNIRYFGYDIAGFFQQAEFREENVVFRPFSQPDQDSSTVKVPVWAAKVARRIEFWSDVVEQSTCRGMEYDTCGRLKSVLGDCFDEIRWMLRDGGWTEEEITEMMTTTTTTAKEEGGADHIEIEGGRGAVRRDKESVMSHVRLLSSVMLRGGWSFEDVVYSLGNILPRAQSDRPSLDFQASTSSPGIASTLQASNSLQ